MKNKSLWIAFTLTMLSAGPMANAAVIASYESHLRVGSDGNGQLQSVVQIKEFAGTNMLVPVAGGSCSEYQVVELPNGFQADLVGPKDQNVIAITAAEGVPADWSFSFTCKAAAALYQPKVEAGKRLELPAHSQLLKHSFINTQASVIKSYSLTVVLPEGMRVQLIKEQLPKPKKSDVLPRVRLDGYEGHQGGLLQMSEMKQGDRTSMILEVVNDERSIGWLIVGLVLAGAHMISFSNMVNNRQS